MNEELSLLSGYLLRVDKEKQRISLDPRSCHLLGFFAPVEEPLELPFRMGEEDKFALRISPENLGAATFWNQKIWNMVKAEFAEVKTLNSISEFWNNNKIPEELMLRITDIVSGSVKSNKDDQLEQKLSGQI